MLTCGKPAGNIEREKRGGLQGSSSLWRLIDSTRVPKCQKMLPRSSLQFFTGTSGNNQALFVFSSPTNPDGRVPAALRCLGHTTCCLVRNGYHEKKPKCLLAPNKRSTTESELQDHDLTLCGGTAAHRNSDRPGALVHSSFVPFLAARVAALGPTLCLRHLSLAKGWIMGHRHSPSDVRFRLACNVLGRRG